MTEYPMHEKLTAIQSTSQSIYDFLEWLGDQKIFLAQYDVKSDACRNCGHDRPHRTELENHTWVCDEDGCGCEFTGGGGGFGLPQGQAQQKER